MDKALDSGNAVLSGSILKNFFALFVPSLIGLLSFSSASLVDGVFIGNYVGAEALAAINLLIPFLTFVFGIAYMLAIGGSVRAGKYIGEGRFDLASNTFSKIVIAIVTFAGFSVTLSLLFQDTLFSFLGATESLRPLMAEYFQIRFPFLLIEVIIIVMYYFVRADGYPGFSAFGILMASALNIVFDYIFMAHLGMGISGAAWATGLAQAFPVCLFMSYFFFKNRRLTFSFIQRQWKEIFQASFNGLSEFINETSGSVVAFILNWLLITSVGTSGVAAITIINYLIFVGIMIVYSFSEACQVFVSQNYGAQQMKRVKQFLTLAIGACLLTSFSLIAILLGFTDQLVGVFLEDEATSVLAAGYVDILWPIFLFNGINICISAYLTGIHAARPSALIAISRGLLLPCILMYGLYQYGGNISFLWALPIAEMLTFVLAIMLLVRYSPRTIQGKLSSAKVEA